MTSVTLAGLTYDYPTGRRALDGVSLTIGSGERLALVGPNGAGKSTLLLHLNGLLRGAGRVEIGGAAVGPATLRDIRRKVGLVFQDPDDQLFLPTLLEDVAFGPRNLGYSWTEARERAMQALAQVGMDERAPDSPHRLSMGQRKRAAIATVLAMDAEVLALDEPTAGLDPRSRRALVGLLSGLPQTLIVATHDLEMAAELCSRVAVLDGGRLVAEGPAGEVLRDGALLDAHGLEQPLSLVLADLRAAAADRVQ